MFLMIDVADLKTSDVNPRFLLAEVDELAKSITAHGVLEPLVVQDNQDGSYTLVAGHRRLAAARKAGLEEVPCVVRGGSESELGRSVLHLVENIQRVDLTPLETALAVARAMEGGLKQKDLVKQLSRSAAWVSKYATIAKAYAKREDAKNGSGAYMVEMTDGDKLYAEARKVLGLDKKEVQTDIPLPDPIEVAGVDEEGEGDKERVSPQESIELEVIQTLRDLAAREHLAMVTGVDVSVEPHGKKGYRISFTYKDEKAARAAFNPG